ncbi:MAG: DUF4296 domain-containing protein [Bacteroidales bacterium]|nr:DUF4296 domain-containing protein [Bacteroidales bacterium]
MKAINCIYILVFFILLSFVSCKIEIPKDVLSEKKMEDVLHDYHIAKAMADEIPYDERYKKVIYIESVFKKHHITQADFDSSMVWYTRNLELLARVYEKVNKRLEKEKESIDVLVALRDDKPLISKEGDSIDVWAWRKNYKLSSAPFQNKLTFVLPSDTNFHNRDTLIWMADYLFKDVPIYDSLFAYPMMSLQAIYENDSTVYVESKIKNSGTNTLMVYADTLGPLKEIRGFIYIPQNDSLLNEYFISDVTLMRYHAQDSLFVDSLAIESDSVPSDTLRVKEVERKDTITSSESNKDNVIRRDPRALRERSIQDQQENEKQKQIILEDEVGNQKSSDESIQLSPTRE